MALGVEHAPADHAPGVDTVHRTVSPVEGTGFEPSVPRRDGIFETAPFELSGTAPSVRRAGSFAREQGLESQFARPF